MGVPTEPIARDTSSKGAKIGNRSSEEFFVPQRNILNPLIGACHLHNGAKGCLPFWCEVACPFSQGSRLGHDATCQGLPCWMPRPHRRKEHWSHVSASILPWPTTKSKSDPLALVPPIVNSLEHSNMRNSLARHRALKHKPR